MGAGARPHNGESKLIDYAGHKVAVGSYADFAEELKRVRRERVPLPALRTASTVPCRTDQIFYVMWHLTADDEANDHPAPEFHLFWEYPDHPKDGFKREHTRFPVQLTDGASDVLLMETNLQDRPVVNGNISVFVKDTAGVELLSHTFAVRGCRSTGDERPEASMPVARLGREVDIVCKNEAVVGTRVRKRICRTKDQITKERQWAQSELGRRQGMQPGSIGG